MSQSKLKRGKGIEKCTVYVVSTVAIKIYSTDDPDEAKERAVGIVREKFADQDGHPYIPRAIVVPYGVTLEEVQSKLGKLKLNQMENP